LTSLTFPARIGVAGDIGSILKNKVKEVFLVVTYENTTMFRNRGNQIAK
jgi:hypothetical protein